MLAGGCLYRRSGEDWADSVEDAFDPGNELASYIFLLVTNYKPALSFHKVT